MPPKTPTLRSGIGISPYLGHNPTMVVTLQNHSGIHNSTSCLNTAKPRHTLSVQFRKAWSGVAKSSFRCCR